MPDTDEDAHTVYGRGDTMIDVPNYSSLEKEIFLKKLPSHFSFSLKISDARCAVEQLAFILHSIPPKYSSPIYNMLGYICYLQDNTDDALQYFDIATSLDKENLVGVANQIQLLRKLKFYESSDILLDAAMSTLKSSPIHVEKRKIGRSIADIAWAHSFVGLNCVADRLYETSLLYDNNNAFTELGAALVHYNFSKHIDRLTECYYMTTSSQKLHSIVQKSPQFNLPKLYLARILNKRDQSQRDGMDPKARQLLNEVLTSSDPYSDYLVAKEKSKYEDWDGQDGCIQLFHRSIKKHPTSFAYMHLAMSKKCRLFKGNNIDENQEIEKMINKISDEQKEPLEVKKSDSSRSERHSKKETPPKAPTPPPPRLITEEMIRELGEINEHLECALLLNPNLQRCFLELANIAILNNSKETAYKYLKQAAENSTDGSVRARAYRNLSNYTLLDGDVLNANTLMDSAFKFGLGTLCQGPERADLVHLLITLIDALLSNNYIAESKQWVDYLVGMDHPEAADLKSRYKALKGTGSKSGGLKVSTAISRTRKPQRTTQITKTVTTGKTGGVT